MIKLNVSAIYLIVLICCWLPACGIKTNTAESKSSVVKTVQLSIVQKLKENGHLPVNQRVALYQRLKKESPDAYNFENEDELTMYG